MPGPQEETYARRLAVVVVVLLEPPGEGDARSLVERAREAIVEVLRGAGGNAEPLAADQVVAAFATPTAAVEAGFRAHACIAADASLSRVGVRLGVHAPGVVTSLEGDAFREAVTAAAQLAARASAGSVCVPRAIATAAEGTLEAVVQDIGAPGPGEPHAYLLVAGEPRRRWARRVVVVAIAAATVAIAGGAVLVVLGRRSIRPSGSAAPSRGIALGVMPFKSVADDARHASLRTVLRDAVNTQLSLLDGVKVYSREFLDFLVTRQGLTEYEAASRLDIRKVLSGTVSAKGDDVRVEVQIIDVATGTLDSSFVVVGNDAALIDLESAVARAVIGKLGIELTVADTHRLEGFRATDVGTYRRFLETEGEVVQSLPAPAETPGSSDGPSGWLSPRSAWADDAGARQEVMAFLERYRTAIEARDLDGLAGLYTQFPPEQRDALVRYFKESTDLRVKLEDVDVAISGDEAIVTYTRKDDFVDARTGRPMHVSGRVTKLLRRTEGRWQLAPGR